MARFDVERIVSWKRLPDGRRIDFTVIGDVDGKGPRELVYTWDPDESGWPMADNITALFMSDEGVVVPAYVFEPPTKLLLGLVMRAKLRALGVDDYATRQAITGAPIPDSVLAARSAILAAYNRFHEDPVAIPEDWEDDKYWVPPS